VHHQVFQNDNEPSLGGADREKQINHPNDCSISP
jgi:hypothetical protein